MTLNAILCEGNAEEEVIEILLENDCLIISYNDLFYNEVLRVRSAKKFCEKYLRTQLSEQVTIYRILDSKNENFKLTKKLKTAYANKINCVKNVITSEEMEILIILAEGRYEDYQSWRGGCRSSSRKPSDYCKIVLRCGDVKEKGFYKSYFDDIEKLIEAIHLYNQKRNRTSGGEDVLALFDLLKEEYKKWPLQIQENR
mgnify:CR=1 FL=1